jgi:hypothetical protein
MQVVNFFLLLAIIGILLRINSKLPGGRDLAQEAMDRYYKEKEKGR